MKLQSTVEWKGGLNSVLQSVLKSSMAILDDFGVLAALI